ncbi:two pore calcium channel protein 2-like [Gigantopelta aegis]|uniref:two pore calcium channel protein 2-like n=1 Tax=Gigantopelta aegis TaxID=1735272 RepID=UPI001B887D0F|nr:two pore calcium channel protein 2-like [Gigantopelta aegis]
MHNSETSRIVTEARDHIANVVVNTTVDSRDSEHGDRESVVREENLNEVFLTSTSQSSASVQDFQAGRHSSLASPWQVTEQSDFDNFSSESYTSTHELFAGLDQASLLQAVVFIEDAYKYRSISHKMDPRALLLYRNYNSTSIVIFRFVVIFVLHVLVIFEHPSSLTLTSDLRFRGERVIVPCWLTEGTEFLCLLLLVADTAIRGYLMGRFYFLRHKWLVASAIILFISLTDWSVSVALGCYEYIRFRRMLRPFFVLSNSTLMKKTVNCLRRTLPEVASVLLLLALHLFIFTLFGMLLFPQIRTSSNSTTTGNNSVLNTFTTTPIPLSNNTPAISVDKEASQYFGTLLDSFMNLLVLLTTANNPDVTMPAYQTNRFFALFFIIFLIVGLYCLMNMLTAVIYNQFRGYFLASMQASLFRRRLGVRAAYEVLSKRKLEFHTSKLGSVRVGVASPVIKLVVKKAKLSPVVSRALNTAIDEHPDAVYSSSEFQKIFGELDKEVEHKERPVVRWFENPRLRMAQRVFLHRYFSYLGSVVALVNVLAISFELATQYDSSVGSSHSILRILNFGFVLYYVLEQIVKLWAAGWRRYVHEKSNIFDGIITLALAIGEIVSTAKYRIPYSPKNNVDDSLVLLNIIKFVNIFIIVRLLRIIPHIKAMSVVASTLIDLVKNLKAFAGILLVNYYMFAILGMELFHDVIKFENASIANSSSPLFQCGTYQQLGYWANNFDDFAAAVVVLWDIMVVNNWMVFLEAFRKVTTAWSYLYFIGWWLLSVVIVLNLFTALILENFIMKWDKSLHSMGRERTQSGSRFEESTHLMSVHSMFREQLQEPADNELLVELSQHKYLELNR